MQTAPPRLAPVCVTSTAATSQNVFLISAELSLSIFYVWLTVHHTRVLS